jgi:hypothetical protein
MKRISVVILTLLLSLANFAHGADSDSSERPLVRQVEVSKAIEDYKKYYRNPEGSSIYQTTWDDLYFGLSGGPFPDWDSQSVPQEFFEAFVLAWGGGGAKRFQERVNKCVTRCKILDHLDEDQCKIDCRSHFSTH